MNWFQKRKLSIIATLFLSFSFVGCQTMLTEPTEVEAGNVVFTEEQFDTLLVKLETCVMKDSLIAVQDSIITEYQNLDNLNKPFWEQEWFKQVLSHLATVGITLIIDNNTK